ncbi:MAG: hypothetical protein FWC73_07375 [Defluviitaleaceae bacterium]|nr:hypothetical protein [Defluviitaleaceae bacterium]
MSKSSTQLADWAVRKIESEYANDICLLLEHNALKLERDMGDKTFSFYIPATNRANGLAKTFIIGGIGYDLFPMSWETIESMADVKHYNTTCLGNAQILWARRDEDRQRFESLQARLKANLQNPQYMLERGKKWLGTVVEIFQDTLFEERVYKVRENASYICDLLAIAVAFANRQYFPHGQTNQLKEIANMKNIPNNFAGLYGDIIAESCPDAQKRLCYKLIKSTKSFYENLEKPIASTGSPDFTELANWYQELCYTWRRVYHWCNENDPINAYIWCGMLQDEVGQWGKKFGIVDIDIMSSYDANNLDALHKRAEIVEQSFRKAIENNGVVIDEYNTIEEFLKAN